MNAIKLLLPLAIAAAIYGWVAEVDGSGLRPQSPSAPNSLIAPGASLEKLTTGYLFTEGPAVYQDGSLFFSDVQASEIHRLMPNGKVQRHRGYTGRGNGLYFDAKWRLVACEMQNRRLSIDDLAGKIDGMVDNHQGAPFKAPNDVWIHPDGGIYFTDPDFAGGGASSSVYFLPSGADEVVRVIDNITLPNGVIGTPDGDLLYVADYSGAATWQYAILGDGTLGERKKFSSTGGDGMTLDESGNVYLAAGDVVIFAPDGSQLETVPVPETVSNVTFGGPDGATLYITAMTSVYSIEMTVRGAFAPSIPPPATATSTPEGAETPDASATPTSELVTPDTPVPSSTPTATPTETPWVHEDWWLWLPLLYNNQS